MYEFTRSGAFMKWSMLDPQEKRLAAISIGASVAPWLLAVVQAGVVGFRFGVGLRFGQVDPNNPADRFLASPAFSVFVLIAILCTIISGLAWWRLSVRQDELFTRVQGYALSRAGLLFLGVAVLWWMFSVPGWVGAFPLGFFAYLAMLSISFFTARALKQWG